MDLSTDRSLQPDSVKLESLVIADQPAAVNPFPGLVYTARQAMEPKVPKAICPTARRTMSKVKSVTGAKS